MAQYTLNDNPISLKVNENTVARPVMRLAPSISANSPITQAGKPTQNAIAPSVKVLWSDNTPATSNDKFIIQVTFQVQSGAGTINGSQSSVTIEPDANGIATLQNWTLGSKAGENTVIATANIIGNREVADRSYMVNNGSQQLVGGPITFTANANAGIISVVVLPNTNTVAVGDVVQLTAVAQLEPGAPDPSWTWSTTSGTIVSVAGNSNTAIVKGLLVGNAQVTATALSGNAQASSQATVNVVAVPPEPAITVSATPSTITVYNNGSTKTTNIKIGRTNYSGNVNLFLQRLPQGVTGIFSPAATTATDSVLTLQATSAAVAGTYSLTVVADGTDVTDASTEIILVVDTEPTGPVCVITEVTIDPYIPVSLVVGETVTVTGKAFGTNCTSQQLGVRYISSNTDIATVSTGGIVTARSYGSATITAVSTTDGTKSASVTILVPPTPSPSPTPPPQITWRSCDGETHQGNPPAGYVSATYTGAGNGICWEPVSIVGFEPDLNTALLFEYQRDSGRLPEPVTITARNPSQAINYRLTLSTNDEIEIVPNVFELPAGQTNKFMVKVTKSLLDKLADGTSDIGLNINIQQI